MNGGVSINTYFDNRVVFSGRKVRNDVQAAVQAHRPRLIVRHINVIEPECTTTSISEPYVKDKSDNDNKTSGKKNRKRNKTVHMNNNI